MEQGPSEFVSVLCKLLGEEQVLWEQADLIPYGFDGTAVMKGEAAVVVLPKEREQVAECVKIARAFDRPIVTRGSGTGLSGGSIPVEGAMVLCTVHLEKMDEIDRENLTVLVEPGVITEHIDRKAAEVGLFYPPDPGSMKISTIGGNVAENSGGLRGLKYGVTRDYVMALEVVLPDGEVTQLGSACVKDVAGYSLKDLFVGSEGTLGVITRIMLKLLPRPESRQTLLAMFPSMEEAAQAVSAIIAAKVIPCTLEFVDQVTLRCVEDYVKIGLPTDAAAVLLVECDGHPAAVEDDMVTVEKILKEGGASQVQRAESEERVLQLASARRQAFSALARRRPTTILEDVTVPRNCLAEMVGFIKEVAKRHDLEIGTFGHMGDGNLHPTILTDEKDEEEMHRVELALSEIVDKTIALGGTITGEHGVGLAKKEFLERQFDQGSYQMLRQVKKTLDPDGVLNPGKIFDVE
ncbi:MAG: FAD-linked oxidase C-terminal domain-containing protein [Akkermansiaceae bacterium]